MRARVQQPFVSQEDGTGQTMQIFPGDELYVYSQDNGVFVFSITNEDGFEGRIFRCEGYIEDFCDILEETSIPKVDTKYFPSKSGNAVYVPPVNDEELLI